MPRRLSDNRGLTAEEWILAGSKLARIYGTEYDIIAIT